MIVRPKDKEIVIHYHFGLTNKEARIKTRLDNWLRLSRDLQKRGCHSTNQEEIRKFIHSKEEKAKRYEAVSSTGTNVSAVSFPKYIAGTTATLSLTRAQKFINNDGHKIVLSRVIDPASNKDATSYILSGLRKLYMISYARKQFLIRRKSIQNTADTIYKLIKPLLMYSWESHTIEWVWVVEIIYRTLETGRTIPSGEYMTIPEQLLLQDTEDNKDLCCTDTITTDSVVRKIRRTGAKTDESVSLSGNQ